MSNDFVSFNLLSFCIRVNLTTFFIAYFWGCSAALPRGNPVIQGWYVERNPIKEGFFQFLRSFLIGIDYNVKRRNAPSALARPWGHWPALMSLRVHCRGVSHLQKTELILFAFFERVYAAANTVEKMHFTVKMPCKTVSGSICMISQSKIWTYLLWAALNSRWHSNICVCMIR